MTTKKCLHNASFPKFPLSIQQFLGHRVSPTGIFPLCNTGFRSSEKTRDEILVTKSLHHLHDIAWQEKPIHIWPLNVCKCKTSYAAHIKLWVKHISGPMHDTHKVFLPISDGRWYNDTVTSHCWNKSESSIIHALNLRSINPALQSTCNLN